ncbi:hypothetical protein CPLU01_13132 [Colletotrichum plurivorum]|uniref:Uncharacterized protein n=1 Tax=Colletotrichum plurivorum TaxID=2175906 RepID=A0A8H6JTR1_9PEZI|nr:hypothetical protein CPLU01_13132 [Colletotrichum plurivorum]
MKNEEMLHRALEFARQRAARAEQGDGGSNSISVEASPAAGEAAPEREPQAELYAAPIFNEAAEDAAHSERVPRARELLMAAIYERLAVIWWHLAVAEREFATVLGRRTACEGHRDGTCECPAPSQELLTAVIRKRFGDLRNELDIILTVLTREDQRVLIREDLPNPQQRLAILNERLDVVVRDIAVVERDIAVVERDIAVVERDIAVYEFHFENLGVPDVLWWGTDPVACEDVGQHIDREIAGMYAITWHLEELVRLRAEGGHIDLEEWQLIELNRRYAELVRLCEM